MSVGSESPSVRFKPSAAKLEEHEEEEENEVFESKDESTSSTETGQSETQESCKEEGEEKECEGDDQGLTEVDLKAEQQSDSNCTGQADKEEQGHKQSITSSAVSKGTLLFHFVHSFFLLTVLLESHLSSVSVSVSLLSLHSFLSTSPLV